MKETIKLLFLIGILFGAMFGLAQKPPTKPKLEYKCEVLNVYDGDTFNRCLIHLGFDRVELMSIRLARFDAPELIGDSTEVANGIIAKNYLIDYIAKNCQKNKFGNYLISIIPIALDPAKRIIAELYDDRGNNINDIMLKSKNVKPYTTGRGAIFKQ